MKNLLLIIGVLSIISCKKAEDVQPAPLQGTQKSFTIEYSEITTVELRSVIYYCIDKQPADSIVIDRTTHKATISIPQPTGYQLFVWASGRRQYQFTFYNVNQYDLVQIYRDPATIDKFNQCEFMYRGSRKL